MNTRKHNTITQWCCFRLLNTSTHSPSSWGVSYLASLSLLAACILVSCGMEREHTPQIELAITLPQALHGQVSAATLYAFHPTLSDNKMLTCTELLAGKMQPTDKRIRLLAQTEIANIADPSNRFYQLKNVEAGDGRIVYVIVYGVGGGDVGDGCAADITVKEGGTAIVPITVYAK